MAVDFPGLYDTTLEELRKLANTLGIRDIESQNKNDLVFQIGRSEGKRDGKNYGRGVLEVHGEGFGFLRSPEANFLPGPDDIYVSQSQIRRFKLQTGDTVIGVVRDPKEGERYLALLRVDCVNGDSPGIESPGFQSLTAIYPDDRVQLTQSASNSAIDAVAPIGLGQRGVIFCQSRVERGEMLRELVAGFRNDSELHVTALLLGETPEEIHEWQQSHAEVIATPFDEPPARHVQVADIVFERARRMVERGDDAVLIVDNLSRLLRFIMADAAPSAPTVSVSQATYKVQRYLSAARALAEGGSLTVIAVVTGTDGSPVNQALAQELQEIINWELHLSSSIPTAPGQLPIDVANSRTKNAARLLTEEETSVRAKMHSELTGEASKDLQAIYDLATSNA